MKCMSDRQRAFLNSDETNTRMKQRSKVPVRQRVTWAVNDDVMTSATARDATGRRLLTQRTRRTCYHLPINAANYDH